MLIPIYNGTKLPANIAGLVLLAALLVIFEGFRVVVLLNVGHDDPNLSAAVNITLAAFVTSVAAERVSSHIERNDK
jgi:ABC-type polysaccharide/polyol phosphate export permease